MAAYEKAAVMHELRTGEGTQRAIHVKEAHGWLKCHVPRYDRAGVYTALEQSPGKFLVIECNRRLDDERESEPARIDIGGRLRKSDLSLPKRMFLKRSPDPTGVLPAVTVHLIEPPYLR